MVDVASDVGGGEGGSEESESEDNEALCKEGHRGRSAREGVRRRPGVFMYVHE